jgi:hypothetical protein
VSTSNHLHASVISLSCQAIAILLSWHVPLPGPAATAHRKKKSASLDMSKQTKQQAALQHLRGLVYQPVERVRMRLQVLA